MIHTSRRSFIGGIAALFAAPAIVKATSLMPLRGETLIVPEMHMRWLTHYEIGTDMEVTRLDVLYGRINARPEWGDVQPGWDFASEEQIARARAQYAIDITRAENAAKALAGEPLYEARHYFVSDKEAAEMLATPDKIVRADLFKYPEVLDGVPRHDQISRGLRDLMTQRDAETRGDTTPGWGLGSVLKGEA